MFSVLRIGVVVGAAAVLAACGGGGGGDPVNGDVLAGKQSTYAVGGTLSPLEITPSGTTPPAIKIVDALTCPANATPSTCSGPTLTTLGPFTFASLSGGTGYQLEVRPQPTGYSCRVLNGNGRVENAAINNIQVICAAGLFSIHGAVTGLGNANPGLQLSNNTDTLSINSDGPFTFSAANNSAYNVRIASEHSHYQCALRNSAGALIPSGSSISGTINAADISGLTVSCAAPVRVSVLGLPSGTGSNLVLSNSYTIDSSNTVRTNDAALTVSGEGNFEFDTELPRGRLFTISASTAHPDYQCTMPAANQVVGTQAINLAIQCERRLYQIRGNATGLGSSGLRLRRDAVTGYPAEEIAVGSDNTQAFEFNVRLPTSATAITLTKIAEPDDRVCNFINGTNTTTATINRADIADISIACTTPAPLTVISTTPAHNAASVALSTPISIVFSHPVDPASVNSSAITLSTSQSTHSATMSVSGAIVTVTPAGKLIPQMNYTLNISSGIRGLNKELLATSVARSFSASNAWTAPMNLGPGITVDGIVGFPLLLDAQIAFAANGNAVIVWNGITESGQSCTVELGVEICFPYHLMSVLSRRFNASSQTWTNTETLASASGDGNLQLASDATGNAVVTWIESGTIWERRYSVAADTWHAARQINSAGRSVQAARLAMRTNGSALLATTEFDGSNTHVYLRQHSVNTSDWNASMWTAAAPITTGSANTYNPRVSVAESGHSFVLWQQQNPAPGLYAISNSTLDTTGWSAPATITSSSGFLGFDVGIDSSGNALTVWPETDGSGSTLYAKRFSLSLGWDANAQVLGQGVGFAIPYSDAPRVSVRSADEAIVTWLSPTGVQRRQLAGGIWLGSQLLGGSATSYHTLFSDTFGNVSVLWTQDAEVSTSRYSIGTGAWSPTHTIDNAPSTAFFPAVAVNNTGTAIILWSKSVALYASRFVMD